MTGILLAFLAQYWRANYHASLYAGDRTCERYINWSKEMWQWDISWKNCFIDTLKALQDKK